MSSQEDNKTAKLNSIDNMLQNVNESTMSRWEIAKDNFGGFFVNVWKSFKKSGKLQFLLICVIMFVIINLILIYHGHMNNCDSSYKNFKNSLLNSFYFSTTQLTTIGYGDITPNTFTAKWWLLAEHFVVLFLALGLATEFGASSALEKVIERGVVKANAREYDKNMIVPDALLSDVIESKKNSRGDITTLDQLVKHAVSDDTIAKTITKKMRDSASRIRQSRIVPVTETQSVETPVEPIYE